MDRTHITQQTSTAVSLRGELGHEAPLPRSLRAIAFRGPLQWSLEGRGWAVLRPTVDFVVLCVAVALSGGGPSGLLRISPSQAPLLVLPPLVLALFNVGGLYRTRMRVLAFEGIVPAIGAVSVAAMGVAVLGNLVHG